METKQIIWVIRVEMNDYELDSDELEILNKIIATCNDAQLTTTRDEDGLCFWWFGYKTETERDEKYKQIVHVYTSQYYYDFYEMRFEIGEIFDADWADITPDSSETNGVIHDPGSSLNYQSRPYGRISATNPYIKTDKYYELENAKTKTTT